MTMFDLFFGLVGTFVLPLAIIIWFFWYVNRDGRGGALTQFNGEQFTAAPADSDAGQRDAEWRKFLAAYKKRGLSKAEVALIDRLLADVAAPDARQRSLPESLEATAALAAQTAPGFAASTALPSQTAHAVQSHTAHQRVAHAALPAAKPANALRQEVDGTLLLLYFGAFLFVAAAGLFVAFSGITGAAKTAVVMATMYVMYMGGIWLFGASKRLQPAGVAFTAIGMAIAPLIGLTAHYYVTQGQYVPLVWGATSLLCVALYWYALSVMKYTFISYFFIFSFLSLFESAVAIVQAPVHYYIWVLILAGMILKFTGVIRESEELRQPAAISSQILIPLSMFVSLVVIERQGTGQLSVTLLLAAVYYTIEALNPSIYRPYFTAAAQLLYHVGLALAADVLIDSPLAAGICLIILAAVQSAVIWFLPRKGELAENFASVAFIAALPAVYLSSANGVVMTLAVALIVVLGAVIAIRQRRSDAFAGAALAAIVLPFVAGLFAAEPQWSRTVLTIAAFVPVLGLWGLWRWLAVRKIGGDWQMTALTLYVIASVVALLPALGVGGWVFLAACAAFATTLVCTAQAVGSKATEYGSDSSWAAAAGIIATLPMLRELYAVDTRTFAAAVGFGLVANILLAFRYKHECNRWLGAGMGIVAPVAIGAGGLGFNVDATGYAYLYLLAMCILVFGRGLARGVYMLRSNVPVSSLYKSASLSYVIGYIAAGGLSLVISLGSHDSRLHTSVILAALLVLTPYIAVVIEKQKRLLALEPWIAMLLLISVFRTAETHLAANAIILAASALSVAAYALVKKKWLYFGDDYDEVQQTTLLLAFVPLIMCLWYDTSDIVPPLTLAIAGGVTMYHAWGKRQADREASGGILVVALMWALATMGVHNLQAHTHLAAATFALYAYWRYRLGDRQNSDNYLYAMLATATIPLALQAIGGTAGDAYGWWLLLEQIGFMILGINIHRRFVTFWGLYVALAAVLYQLRHLGWAALSFLALFVIGMAIYRLLRTSERQ